MELKAVLLIAVAMLGMCYALLGSLKLTLAKRLGIAEDRMGGLVAAFGFMVGPGGDSATSLGTGIPHPETL